MKNLSAEFKGLLFAFLAMFLFNVSDGAWKYALQSFTFPVVLTIHSACASLLLIFYTRFSGLSLAMKSKKNNFVFAATLVASMSCFGFSLNLLPIAQLFVILLTAPLVTLLGARIYLKETLSGLQILSVIIGFSGALVVVVPQFFGAQDAGYPHAWLGIILAISQVLIASFRAIFVRCAAQNENAFSMTLASFVLAFVVYIIPAYHAPSPENYGPLIIVAVATLAATSGMIFYVRAFQLARAGLAGASQYSQMIWAALLGTLIFHEPLTFPVLMGASLILISGILLVIATIIREKGPF